MREIRYVEWADYDDWASMVRDYDSDIPDPDVAWTRFFTLGTDLRCFVAVEDQQLVGFVNFFPHQTPFNTGQICYLANLYVKPEFRRRGIARALVNEVIEKAVAMNWLRVYWVTENENPARALYDSYAESDYVRYHINLKGFV